MSQVLIECERKRLRYINCKIKINQQGNVTTKIVKVKDVLILKNKAASYFTSKRWVY